MCIVKFRPVKDVPIETPARDSWRTMKVMTKGRVPEEAILTQAPSPRLGPRAVEGSPRGRVRNPAPCWGSWNSMTSTWMRFSTCLTSNPVSSWPLSPRRLQKKNFGFLCTSINGLSGKLALPEMPESSVLTLACFCVSFSCEKPSLEKSVLCPGPAEALPLKNQRVLLLPLNVALLMSLKTRGKDVLHKTFQ